jgi:hypothetical protein
MSYSHLHLNGHLACLVYGPVSWRQPVTGSCIRGGSDREPV